MKYAISWFTVFTVIVCAIAPLEAKGKRGAVYKTDFAEFVKHVDKTYPFFDLKKIRKDWKAAKKDLSKRASTCKSDGEFILLVWDAIKVLRDAHMSVTPKEGIEVDWPKQQYPGLGFLAAADKQVVILHGPPGRETTFKPGMVVTKIDGKPARKFLEKQAQADWEAGGGFSSPQRARIFTYRTPLVGEPGTKHKMTYLDEGKSKTVTLRCQFDIKGWPRMYNTPKDLQKVGKSFWYTKFASGVGYMYWRRVDRSLEEGIAQALEKHGDAKGWIVDLRGNSGGGYNNGLIQAIKSMKGPVAVVIDAGCISAGETLVRDLVGIHKARVFGTTTAGSSSSKKMWTFPSGIATVRYSTRSRRGVGGTLIEFNGIDPHEVVEPKAVDVQEGRNTEILAAEAYVLKRGRK